MHENPTQMGYGKLGEGDKVRGVVIGLNWVERGEGRG